MVTWRFKSSQGHGTELYCGRVFPHEPLCGYEPLVDLSELKEWPIPNRASVAQEIYGTFVQHFEDNELLLNLTEKATDAVLRLLDRKHSFGL